MPAINPILQKEQRRRSRILAGFTVSLTVLFAGIEILWMFAYHISLYISVPIILITSLLQILATGGLVTQFIGFYMALKPIEKDPFNPINKAIDIKENTRIAVTMPIYHEDARRVAGAFSAMIEELSHYKEAKHFDWFILSDSRKEDVIVQEQKAVFLLKEKFPEIGIHYRHHIMNTFAKVGNTSDFFRRWGGEEFKAVIMLDGDSIMPAETMVTLARTIEGNDTIGLIQVPPYEIGEATLFSAQRNFGMLMIPIMFAATYYFKIGRAFYLGHHAILRTETMTKDCSLPVLSRTKLFAEGKPMSHDVFEAALMEGAGWETYVLPQLVGFDQQVYNIKEWAIRENRWLVGSMNWLRLWRYKQLSFHGKSNVLFLSCLYSNAFLGVIGLCLSYYGSYYFFKNYLYSDLFLRHFQNLVMFSIAIFFFILLSPICLTLLYYHKSGRLRQLGGVVKVTFSYFLVYCLKSFLSIIKMFCLARFLFNWLKGKKIVWGAQDREYRGALSWEESFKFS